MGEYSSKTCTIIIPVYNGERFLRDTIESCFLQKQDANVEIIVIDDCSSDSSRNVIESYGDRLISVYNDINCGITKTVNKAVKHATGDYLLLLGHDDVLPKSHVSIMLGLFSEDVSFVHCNSKVIDENGAVTGVSRNDIVQNNLTKNIKCEIISNNFVSSTGLVIKKKSFEDVGGFDEQFTNYGEWLLWIKMAKIGNVAYCDKTQAYYRRHSTNITNTFRNPLQRKKVNAYKHFCMTYAYSHLGSSNCHFCFSCLIIKYYYLDYLDRFKMWIKKQLS